MVIIKAQLKNIIHMFIKPIKYYDANISIDTLNQTLNVIFQIINKKNSYSNNFMFIQIFIKHYSFEQDKKNFEKNL